MSNRFPGGERGDGAEPMGPDDIGIVTTCYECDTPLDGPVCIECTKCHCSTAVEFDRREHLYSRGSERTRTNRGKTMRTREEVQKDIRDLDRKRTAMFEELLHREYFPALTALRAECKQIGHHYRCTEQNMIGTIEWSVCGYCGARYDQIDL